MSKNACAKIASGSDDRTHETWTADRDYGSPEVDMITTRHGTGSRTRLRLRGFGNGGCKVNLELNGHEARTIYRVLRKHYGDVSAAHELTTSRDSWRNAAVTNAAEKLRLGSELSLEQARCSRTREALMELGLELLKTVTVEMPMLARSAYEAGKESMVEPARMACRVAYRAGMSKGFEAAQQLELFSELTPKPALVGLRGL